MIPSNRVELFLKTPLRGPRKGTNDNCENQVEQEKLANHDNREAVNSAYEGEVDIHEYHDLEVPSLASDHLEHCKKRSSQVVKICNSIVDVGSLLEVLRLNGQFKVILDVSTGVVRGTFEIPISTC